MTKWWHLFWRLYRCTLSDPYRIAQVWRKLGMQVGDGMAIYGNVKFGRAGADPMIIGRRCVLTGCTILAHDASVNSDLNVTMSPHRATVIEDGCFIGIGAIVLMGCRIGQNSIVGAGAVVTQNVPPDSVVAGNPARKICSREELVKKRRQQISEGILSVD